MSFVTTTVSPLSALVKAYSSSEYDDTLVSVAEEVVQQWDENITNNRKKNTILRGWLNTTGGMKKQRTDNMCTGIYALGRLDVKIG